MAKEGLQQVNKSWDRFAANISAAPKVRKTLVARALINSGELIVARAKTRYLTGGTPLRVQSGRLRSSVTRSKVRRTKDMAWIEVGTNVWYGRVHEFGGTFTQNVPAQIRTITKAWGRPIKATPVFVRAYTRTVNYPPRPWLRPAFNRSRIKIKREFEKIGLTIGPWR